jgi:hypothetical protein
MQPVCIDKIRHGARQNPHARVLLRGALERRQEEPISSIRSQT